ncbi:MAG: ATP-binding protein, partial [Nitrospiraceae bacterium]|nr:ATP-binding protein [Nitrospiraceae bacterium]
HERGASRMSGKEVPEEYEFKVVTRWGDERWVSATAGVIEYEGAPAVIATLSDITDRKHAADEKVRLYEERIREEERHARERENLVMDLHDGIGGITTNIRILAELAQQSPDFEGFRNKLSIISQLAKEGITEIRSFMRIIETSGLSWHMLAVEIRSQGNALLEPHGIGSVFETNIDGDTAGDPGSLLCLNLFKIHKEALTNAIKHARATMVTVNLSVNNHGLRFVIGDNGIGCSKDESRGRGLPNIRKRAASLGGTVNISSDSGTRLALEIPLPLRADSGVLKT